MKKKLIAAILLAALIVNIFSLVAFAAPDAATPIAEVNGPAVTDDVTATDAVAAPVTTASYTTKAVSADFEKVAANDALELYVNKTVGAIGVKDLQTGFIWYSSVPSDTYDRTGMTDLQNKQLDSLFVLTYTILNDNNAQTQTAPINNLEPQIKVEKIADGVALNYLLEDLNLQITFEVVLDGDSLVVRIPQDKVIEGEGTESKMQALLDQIQEFIDECTQEVDALSDLGVKSTKSDIKNAYKKLDELQELTDSVDSLIGVAAVQSKAAIILQDELQVYLFGGGGKNGAFYNAQNSEAGADQASTLKKTATQLQSKLKKCVQNFSRLTTIKLGGIVDIELLPNFGAAADNEQGYVFFPDGSGALTYNTPNHGESTEIYETSIYSEQSVDMAWENNRDATGLKRTMLPVYGSKKDNQAMLAIIEGGDTNASVCLLPSGNTFNLNRINAKFKYRNAVQVTSSSEYATGMAQIFEKQALEVNAAIRYQFLNGKNYTADYSGMASAYRDRLLEEGQLKKSELLNGEMPLALDFVAGTWKSMLFYQSYVSISSFDEMGIVADEMKQAGINNLLMHVQSWEKQTAPSTLKVPKAAGGAQGVQSLTEKLKANGGNLFLGIDLVDADTFENNISESKLALDTDLRIFEFQSFWYKLFSPLYVQKNTAKTIKSLGKLGNPGVAVERMGELIYHDYNDSYKLTRSACAETWTDIYDQLAEVAPTAVYGGNAYLFEAADWLMDIPMSSSGYTFSDESVPFYQMVVHGSIPYSSKPFNHFYDKDKEKLQTIEYGCIPLYKLTYNDSSTLRKLFNAFTTPYADVKDEIIETYNEFNGKLAGLTTEYMVKHESLTKDVKRVEYSDGTVIYLNYADAAYTTADGVQIPAKDYVIA